MPARAPGPSWITDGSIVRGVWRLALPMTVTALLDDMLSIVDMIFVGSLGPTAIAGVATCGVLLSVIYNLGVGVTIGCTALVAQAVGAGDRTRAEEAAAQSLLMVSALSVLVAALGIPLAATLLNALGAEAPVVAAGTPYLQVSAGGSLVMLLSITFGAAVRGAGDAITPLKVAAVVNLINMALDPVLIFGWLGMPALGVVGSAWASVAARLVGCCMLARVFFAGRHESFHLRLHHLRPVARTVTTIFRIGVFGSGQMLMINLSGLVVVRVIAMFGEVALAAYGIGMRLWFAVLTAGIGVGNAAATLVGQNVGAGKMGRAARAAWVTAGLWAAISAAIGLVFFAFAANLIAIFNSHAGVVAAGTGFLRWLSITLAFTALSAVLGRAMNGAGDTFWPMVISAAAMFALRIPLAYGLARSWDSAAGVWAALAVSNVVQGLLFASAFLWGRWKTVGQRLVRQRRGAAL